MVELKTLKDIDLQDHITNGITDLPLKDELQAEAIKWINELKERAGKDTDYCLFCGKEFLDCLNNNSKCKKAEYSENCLAEHNYECSDISGTIKWIKHFFNITEEDLK